MPDLYSQPSVPSPQVLQNRQGHALGSIERRGGRLVLLERQGHLLGSYEADGTTRDRQGHLVGYGYLLPALLFSRER